MADNPRIGNNEIKVGVPLPLDVFDAQGVLLLKEGYIIQTQRQLELLQERGAHFLTDLFAKPEAQAPALRETRELSPSERIDDIYFQLSFLKKHGSKADFNARILSVARRIQQACDTDADGSLGAMIMDQREKYSIIHEVHCTLVCELMLRQMGRSAEDRLPLLAAGLTMNLDMLELQDKLFHQRGKLDEEQRREVRNHPYRSVEILQELGVSDDAWLKTVLQHHELIDQSGYPQGLPDKEICEEARILALADIYCAKLYPRAYRPPLQPTAAAYDIFTGARGHGLDKDLSKLFISELGIFHPGSFVRLRNGELAVVARRGEKIHNPIVYSVMKANGEPYFEPRRRDSSNPEFTIDKCIARGDVKIQINTGAIWRRA